MINEIIDKTDMDNTEKLLQKAKEILNKNWEDIDEEAGYTKPSKDIYPFQWNWDAGFVVYGYTHFDLDKAIKEYKALFRGQWQNGMLPHIIFHKPDKNYFPNTDFWQACEGEDVCLSQSNVPTSGITQPPIHAMSMWHTYKALIRDDDSRAEEFLKFAYENLYELHKYFMTHRDPEKSGGITIYHPWESGFDNSPRWDDTMKNIKVTNLEPYKRVDTNHVDPSFRPSNEDYDKYVYLVQNLRNKKYNDEEIYKDHQFMVKDVVASAIMYLSNERLKQMAEKLGKDTSEINEWMSRYENNFRNLFMAEDGLFYDYDLVAKKHNKVKTAGSIIPLISGLLTNEELNLLSKEITETGLVSSTDDDSQYYNPDLYWRGPVWINVNWLIWKGCLEYDLGVDIHNLRQNIINLVDKEGFWEYFAADDHSGLGANDFSWTAALIIDLISHELGF